MKINKHLQRFNQNINKVARKVNHSHRVIMGFNFLVEKKGIIIDDQTMQIYPEILGSDPKEQKAWLKNAYLYCRLKLKYPEGFVLYFRDIETGSLFAKYDGLGAKIFSQD